MSSPNTQYEHAPATFRAKEFVELHGQVQASVKLLDTLESFLSTFQTDLSAVSGQIYELQDRSKDIENRLKARKRIEKPLSNLLDDICIPPALATLILDTPVGEPWLDAVRELAHRLTMTKSRLRVKAARDMAEVAEGIRIVAATKLRTFFLALLHPLRTSVTTNMQVLQAGVLLKHQPLYAFLQVHAPTVAQELQRAYAGAARTYYETGFRRYARSLSLVKAKNIEKLELITTPVSGDDTLFDPQRLAYARVEGPSVTLSFLADDKSYKEPTEALVRSLMLVLMDNATAEYAFVTTFFRPPPRPISAPGLQASTSGSGFVASPSALLTPRPLEDDMPTTPLSATSPNSALERTPRPRRDSTFSTHTAVGLNSAAQTSAMNEQDAKDAKAALDALWKQIMDPVLEYTQTFVTSAVEPAPGVVPLLTMIRLTEDVMGEVQRRGCAPLESFVFGIRLRMWPLFQKGMSEHVDALKKLVDGANAGTSMFFGRGTTITGDIVGGTCKRYAVLFNAFIALTYQEEETMIFSNLLRLRQELLNLIAKYTDKITDPTAKATTQSNLYESLLQHLSRGARSTAHPKAQGEIAWWKEREEEARKRIRQLNH